MAQIRPAEGGARGHKVRLMRVKYNFLRTANLVYPFFTVIQKMCIIRTNAYPLLVIARTLITFFVDAIYTCIVLDREKAPRLFH